MATDTATKPDRDFTVSSESPALVAQPLHRARSTWHFARHFVEMFVAMMIGMMVLGGLDSGILSAFGTSIPHVRNSAPEVFALVMALNMTVGMTLWMRYRRHSWAMCAEMAGAMFLPALAALVLLWCSVIHTRAVGGVSMGAMLPAMLTVMLLRRNEYSQPIHKHTRA